MKGKSILVVDNHEGVPKIVAEMLFTLFGRIAVNCAESVGEALGKIAGKGYDLVIANLRLDGESGGDVIARYLLNSRSGVKVIMMSSHEWDFEPAIKSGANAFLRKPFSLDELREAVLSLFGG